nr:hypothetical protein [Tanacetum cinerariifolium]
SDSDESGVTYTDISSPFEELSDIGSSRADDHEHLMLPEMLEDPYMEVSLQAPPSPDYIPGPEEPDHLSMFQESDFEVHPEDDDDEDPEEDLDNYLADGGDDSDDKEESSEDDEDEEDDEMDVEADKEEEEEEHPAPVDSVVVAPTSADQAPSAKETEPFEMDESATTPSPHPAYRATARISIPAPIPFQPLPLILSPPSPILSPAPPPSPIRSLGYRAAMIRLRDAASTSYSPPLQLPSASRREDRPEVTIPPRKRLDIALGPRYKVGESSSAAAARPAGGFRAYYGFVAMMDREIMRDPEREVGYGITDSWDEIKPMAPRRTTRSTADQETVNATMVTNAQLQALIDQGVTAALAARDALRSTNGDDSHNSGTGIRRTERATRECTYTDFLKCQPLPYKGTEGVTVGHEAAYGMTWKTLMKMMTEKYCPRNEIRKLEMEL